MTDCFICNKAILNHTEGMLHKCLKKLNEFVSELVPLVDRVLILNGAGTKYKNGGYSHK